MTTRRAVIDGCSLRAGPSLRAFFDSVSEASGRSRSGGSFDGMSDMGLLPVIPTRTRSRMGQFEGSNEQRQRNRLVEMTVKGALTVISS